MTRERRRFFRVPIPFDAKYRFFGELTQGWRTVRTLNLSAGGMRFKSSDLLDVGGFVEVQIQLPSEREPLMLRGRIVWSQAQASGVTENGLEFLEATPQQQAKIDELVDFLKKGIAPPNPSP